MGLQSGFKLKLPVVFEGASNLVVSFCQVPSQQEVLHFVSKYCDYHACNKRRNDVLICLFTDMTMQGTCGDERFIRCNNPRSSLLKY